MADHLSNEFLAPDLFVEYAKEHGCEEGVSVKFNTKDGNEIIIKSIKGPRGCTVELPFLEKGMQGYAPEVISNLCRRLDIPDYHRSRASQKTRR